MLTAYSTHPLVDITLIAYGFSLATEIAGYTALRTNVIKGKLG
jgi:hypothetical protein